MLQLRLPSPCCLVLLLFSIFAPTECSLEDFFNISNLSPKLGRRAAIDLANFQVPLSNGSTSLPSPTSSLKLVTLGRGTQNYTCPSPSTTSSSATTASSAAPTPSLIGARASLLDLSPLLPFLPASNQIETQAIFSLITEYVLEFSLDALVSESGLDVVGHHIFNAAGTPCFMLGKAGMGELQGKKDGDVMAPDGKGVDWLMLDNKNLSPDAGDGNGDEKAKGKEKLQQVYRVDTAGGKPPSGGPQACNGGQGGQVEVEYAALYWFFGP